MHGNVGPMKRAFLASLIAFAWLLLSTFLLLRQARGDVLLWQGSRLLWPGTLVAVAVEMYRNGGLFSREGWSDILIWATAKFWIAALTNLVFFSVVVYVALGFLRKVRAK
jgi:uncharacterized membrane protein YbhN (UPF0104 family)